MTSRPITDLLADLEKGIALQRHALASDDADALELASRALGSATSALANARTKLDANQLEQVRRLQLALQSNRELLDRTSAARKRALEALIGPNTTYSAAPTLGRPISASRVRTA